MTKPEDALAASILQFPLVVIDFEATALSLESYPIEVGVARAESPAGPIISWSALIAPDRSWDVSAQWDPDAQRVHGISPWDLCSGAAARDVMADLNAWIGEANFVWCDGGHYDAHWLKSLADAAGTEPSFTLGDLAEVLAANHPLRERYLGVLNRLPAPHRAGPDAVRICAALMSLITD